MSTTESLAEGGAHQRSARRVRGWRLPPRGRLGGRLLLGGAWCLRWHARWRQGGLRCSGKGVLRIIAADREATGVDWVVRCGFPQREASSLDDLGAGYLGCLDAHVAPLLMCIGPPDENLHYTPDRAGPRSQMWPCQCWRGGDAGTRRAESARPPPAISMRRRVLAPNGEHDRGRNKKTPRSEGSHASGCS